jgi:phage protein D
MTVPAATQESGLPESYYAPDFLVEVENTPLDPGTKVDVLEVKVVLDIDELASVDLKLDNYDGENFDIKWSDSDQFRLGNRVHVQLGYADRLVSMLRGRITTLTPEFPSDGATTLTVRVMDSLVLLKDSRPPEAEVCYRKMKDWQIAQQVAQRHNLRFEHDDEGPEHELVVQRNTDDLSFLTERASRIDFKVFMRTDPETGEDVLHFRKPTDGREAASLRTYILTWGSLRSTTNPPSMIEFKPTITASDQVQSVTVRGWDPATKQPIAVTASAATTPGVSGSGDATGPAAAERVAGAAGKQEAVVDAPVASADEAKALAESLLAERAYRFLTATGKAIGLPDLRPGDNIEIGGVGTRFSGTYFVTKATHTLNNSGLITEFDVRKTYEGDRP